MAQDFDPHILATMTEEERASILEEQSPEEKAAIVAIDTGKQADLDMFVKSLANDAKNGDKPAEWFLVEAHKRVKALHGLLGSESNCFQVHAPLAAVAQQFN